MFHRYTFGFLCLLTTAAPAAAQILYGVLVGNVTDKTQAAVAGATVTVTNEQTGSSRSGSSGDAGIYQFPTLVPGPYTLMVQAKGFRTYKKTGVVIEANVTERVN